MDINIGIAAPARQKITTGLSALLADSYTLYLKTHKYHWNVTGPMFDSLHNMFEAHYNALFLAVDEIAERIRALGEFAPGSYAEFSKLTSIEEASAGDIEALVMVKDLLAGHETVVQTARKALPAAEEAGDEATVDLLTQRMQYHEKTAWMLRSILG